MKLINAAAIIILLNACNQKGRYDMFKPVFEKQHSPKAILFSCIRCSCIQADINELIRKNNPDIAKYIFLGDTACLAELEGKNKAVHISQSAIDSLSVDFYNILIYKSGKIRMVKTEDSKNIATFLAD